MRTALRNILFDEDVATSGSWDINQLSPLYWLSLHPDAAATSTVTIETGASSVTDASGNGYTASQSTHGFQPSYLPTGFNGFPCLDFDGGNDFLESAFQLLGNPEFTVMAVYKKDVANAGCLYGWGTLSTPLGGYGFYDDNSLIAFSYGASFTTIDAISTDALIISDTKPIGAINLSTKHKNGVLQSPLSSSANTPNIQAGNLALGKTANLGFYFNGQLAEFAIFPAPLSDANRQKAEGKLADRWWREAGLSVPLDPSHPYYLSPP